MDVAKLGFSVDTKPVDDATVSLNKLVPAAKNAETASKGFVAAINGVKTSSGALGQAASGMAGLSSASLRAGSAMGTVQSAAVGAAGAIKVLGLAGARQGPPTALWDAYRASLLKVPAAANGAKSALDRLGASANDNINRLQSTPGNIAAQFQDIGVTAAGGMNPLLIALQQGTQLSAAMQGGIGNLLDGIGQLLNATTILTIGLVALGAALLQNINWTELGVSALNLLADVMEAAAPYALALGATLLLAFAPQIIAAVYSLVVAVGTALVSAIVNATAALWALALANPFTAIILAVAATIAAFVYFGKATVDSVKDPINFIIGGFVGAYNAIKKTWSMLPAAIGDAVIQAANSTIAGIESMVNGVIARINGLVKQLPFGLGAGLGMGGVAFGRINNPYAGSAAKVGGIASSEINAAQNVDYVGKIQGAVVAGANYLVDKVRGLASGLGADAGKKEKGGAGDAAKGSSGKTEAEKQADAFDKLRMSTEAYVRSKAAETAAIGLGAREAAILKHQTDLTNQAIQQGIPLDEQRTASITAWAAAMADADMKLLNAQGWQKANEEMDAVTASFRAQMDQIGMTADQTSKYKWEVLWLNDQLKKLQDASPEQIAALREFAAAAATDEIAIRAMNEELDRTRDAMSFVRDGVKGFVSDLKNGLEQGKNFFSAFGDAVLNILNKIIDKLVDVALNAALGGSGPGAGGFLSAITKIGVSLFGGSSGAGMSIDNPQLAGIFAKGGTFTNGIVDSPTLFKFAKGTGMMGEAGPEAIMPLKRGANGSLGVEVVGANDNRGAQAAAPNITITNNYVISGSSTADMQATVRQSAEQTKDQLRREIPQVLSEYQRNGAIA